MATSIPTHIAVGVVNTKDSTLQFFVERNQSANIESDISRSSGSGSSSSFGYRNCIPNDMLNRGMNIMCLQLFDCPRFNLIVYFNRK